MELLDRIASETPKWFKRIRAMAIVIGGSASAVQTFIISKNLQVPDKVNIVLWCLIAAGIAAGGTATTACEAPPEKQRKKKKTVTPS